MCVGDVFLCCGRGGAAAYGQVFLRRDRLGIVCSCARVLVCSCARVLVCSLGPSPALSEWESRCSLSSTAESVHVGAIHVGRCLLAAAFMRCGGVVASFVRRPEQAMNISRIE